jgi:hypothetical protein
MQAVQFLSARGLWCDAKLVKADSGVGRYERRKTIRMDVQGIKVRRSRRRVRFAIATVTCNW